MNSILKSAPLLLAAGLALSGSNAAHAQVTINYSLGAFTFNTPTNYAKFALNTRTNTLTLLPGVVQTVNIQGISFYISNTSNLQTQDYMGNASRTLTVNGVTQSAVQGYDLTTSPGDGSSTFANDYLSFAAGTPSQVLTFDLGSQGILKFTPEPLDPNSFQGYDTGEYISNDRGQFLLTPAAVPESSSVISTGILLMLGLGAFALRSRKRSAAKASIAG